MCAPACRQRKREERRRRTARGGSAGRHEHSNECGMGHEMLAARSPKRMPDPPAPHAVRHMRHAGCHLLVTVSRASRQLSRVGVAGKAFKRVVKCAPWLCAVPVDLYCKTYTVKGLSAVKSRRALIPDLVASLASRIDAHHTDAHCTPFPFSVQGMARNHVGPNHTQNMCIRNIHNITDQRAPAVATTHQVYAPFVRVTSG